MKKNAGSFVLVIYGLLVIYMVGCGSLEEDTAFVSANFPSGSNILPDSTVSVTFDNTPVNVNVEIQGRPDTSFFWELDGKKLTVRGNPKFQADRNYMIIITWATGRKILNYTILSLPDPIEPVSIDPRPPTAAFAGANPADGSTIAANATITVSFDNDPGYLSASAGAVTGSGKSRRISGPFPEGALALTLNWTNGGGSYTLNYTVAAGDNTPPAVTGGTVEDGEEDVEPANINEGGIEIIFSEEVSGNIALQTEAGESVGWLGSVEGMKGMLEAVAGKEIGNETTYVIAGKVSDAAGNELEFSISFTTKGKE